MASRGEFVAALRAELPEAVRTLQSGNIAPVDIPQSTIGPGIGVFSRYSKVVESDGSAMNVSAALSIINDVLGEVLDGEESEMDRDSRFALAWYAQYGYQPASSGEAISLAQAKNTSLDGVVNSGIGDTRGGKFRLFRRDELAVGWSPLDDHRRTVWESTQYLIAALDRSETDAADLLQRLGGYGESARQLAYLLFKKSTDKKWADEAASYNGLIEAWPTLRATEVASTADRLTLDFES
jgi:putative DNA methylase